MLEEQKKELILILQSMITETDSTLMCEYDKKEIGIVINAPSMNIISGLIKNLNDENIPISDHYTGKITKDIVIKTSGLYIKSGKEQYKSEYIKKYAVILSFDPVLDRGDDDELLDNMDPIILKMCKESDIRIITGKTVYGLLAKYKKYSDQLDEKFYKKYQNIGGQFKLQILPQFVFLKTTPLMFGVKVIDGEVKIGTTLCAVNDKTKVILGKIFSMQKNKKNVELGKINDELCIRIENDHKIVYGDDFDESYIIRRYMTEDEEDIKKFIDKINQQFYL
jgi:translation initiation factor 5B